MVNKELERATQIYMAWFSFHFSAPIILGTMYFSGFDLGINSPAIYELYFLLGGVLLGLMVMPLKKRFQETVRQRPVGYDESYWGAVARDMMIGVGVAFLPFFVGMGAFFAGGFMRVTVALTCISAMLLFQFKPPRS